jgi:hypothetical protein
LFCPGFRGLFDVCLIFVGFTVKEVVGWHG